MAFLNAVLGNRRRGFLGGYPGGRMSRRRGRLGGLAANPLARMAVGSLLAYGARRFYARRHAANVPA